MSKLSRECVRQYVAPSADSTLTKFHRLADQVWPRGSSPTLSIICTAYNHEKYLQEAIEGFLMQRTSFPVDILIHDDASTDSTQAIIKDYESRFPTLIRSVIQSENQYSKGNRPIAFLPQMTQGKYVAICEGDDYWNSDTKLQTQYEMLEARPDASACIHRADGLIEATRQLVPGMFGPPQTKPEFGIDDFICGENFVATASIVARRRVLTSLPAWLREVPHGDIVILSIAALTGPVLYTDQSMTVYRKHRGGIHSGETPTIQILNCLRTLITLGVNLELASRPSFKTGVAFRLSQLEHEAASYEESLRRLEAEHLKDRGSIERIMNSRTFKLGIALSGLKRFFVAVGHRPLP